MWKGIDVSDNNGTINWAQVKAAGVEFAILRSVRRSGKADYQFAANLTGCRAEGIPVAVYKYTYATTPDMGRKEAAQVIELLRSNNLQNTLVWWDVEDRETLRPLGRSKLTACIAAAREVIEAAGYRFGIYVGLYVVKENWFSLGDFSGVPFWVARYPSGATKTLRDMPADKYRPQIEAYLWGWQYSSNGSVAGIVGPVDMNVCYRDPSGCSAAATNAFWCVSIADVATEQMAETVAAMYPGSKVHKAAVLDAGGVVIWLVSAADVSTQTQALEAQRKLAGAGISGLVHKIRLV